MTNQKNEELIFFYNVENLFPPDPKTLHILNPTNSGLRNWDEKRYDNKNNYDKESVNKWKM